VGCRTQATPEEGEEFTRLRDKLSAGSASCRRQGRKNYVFDGLGKETLADLFDSRSQLIVYHFMFGPVGVVARAARSCPIISTAPTDMVTEPVDFQPACSTTVRGASLCVRHASQPRRWSSNFCTRLGAMTSARRKI
jgi:predicted dithiol-disulfide oxidoreductase (DUF899 family)